MTADADLLERQVDVLAFLQRCEASFASIAGLLRQALAPNGVLAAELAVIGVDGTWTKDFPVQFAALSVANHGSSTMTIGAGPPRANAPTQGPGVALVPADGFQTVNISENAVTLYGAPGDTATVQIFRDAQGPAYGPGGGAAAASAGGSPGPTAVAYSAATGVLVAARPARKGVIIFNNATVALYVTFGAVSAVGLFTAKVGAGQLFSFDNYTGVVSGIWDAAGAGSAMITEVT